MSEKIKNESFPGPNVIQFKSLSYEHAIENIYNTVSQKIPLKYENIDGKKIIKVPRLKGNHFQEFEGVIRSNIQQLKLKDVPWCQIEQKFKDILDFIIPVFKINAMRLADKRLSEQMNFQEYYSIWERVLKEEKEKENLS
jgi:hypothetical protein